MTDYPVIDPADVREGDVVRLVTHSEPNYTVNVEGTVRLLSDGRPAVGPHIVGNLFGRTVYLIRRATDPEPPALTAEDLDLIEAHAAPGAHRDDVPRLIAALRQAWAQMDEANADGWGWKPRALAAERERDEAQAEALARRSQPEVKP